MEITGTFPRIFWIWWFMETFTEAEEGFRRVKKEIQEIGCPSAQSIWGCLCRMKRWGYRDSMCLQRTKTCKHKKLLRTRCYRFHLLSSLDLTTANALKSQDESNENFSICFQKKTCNWKGKWDKIQKDLCTEAPFYTERFNRSINTDIQGSRDTSCSR